MLTDNDVEHINSGTIEKFYSSGYERVG